MFSIIRIQSVKYSKNKREKSLIATVSQTFFVTRIPWKLFRIFRNNFSMELLHWERGKRTERRAIELYFSLAESASREDIVMSSRYPPHCAMNMYNGLRKFLLNLISIRNNVFKRRKRKVFNVIRSRNFVIFFEHWNIDFHKGWHLHILTILTTRCIH